MTGINDSKGNALELGDYVQRVGDGTSIYQVRKRNGNYVAHFGGGYLLLNDNFASRCEKVMAVGIGCSPLGPGAELFKSCLDDGLEA